MTLIILTFLISFFSCAKQPKINSQDNDSMKILEEMFTDNIRFKKNNSSISIEYCPDNTCDKFSTTLENSSQKLSDFAYLYLYYVSSYIYLKKFKNKTGKKYVSGIIKRNSDKCEDDSEIDLAKCTLKTLAKDYSIIVTFIRFDEGGSFEIPCDLNDELKRLTP